MAFAARSKRGRLTTRIAVFTTLLVTGLTLAPPAQALTPPVANANGPYSGSAGVAVSFSSAGSSDADGTIVAYLWDFGDGRTSIAPNPTHIYAGAGTFTVSLTVTDDEAATDTDETTAEITAAPNLSPIADANGPYTGTAGLSLALSGAGSSDPDGTITAYFWDFGDGTTGAVENPTHVYAAAGTYTVSLTVTDNDGATDTNTTAAVITAPANVPPVSDGNGPYEGTVGAPVAFSSAGSTDVDGTLIGFLWDFGDGTTSIAPNPTHLYPAADTYTVSLTVTDNDGATGTAETTAEIAPAPNVLPEADANGPYAATAGQSLVLSGAGSSDPDGTITAYFWDFGDGANSTAENPTHTYLAAGTYTVSLTVTDDDGATDTDATAAVIAKAPPVAVGNGPYSGTINEELTFSSTGSQDPDGAIVEFLWDFGDGTTSSEANPAHSYATLGVFTVMLTVTDNDGLTDTYSTSAAIGARAPVPSTNGPYLGTVGIAIPFSSTGSMDPDGTITSYLWRFGDGASSIEPNPEHTYSAAGVYSASLTLTDDDGARATATTTVTVSETGTTDLVVLVEDNGRWHLRYPNGTERTFFYGIAGDVPLMGDWNGDGLDTPGMFRPKNGFVYLTNTLPPDGGVGIADPGGSFFFGMAGDQVLVGDWDGDGRDTLGIRRGARMFLTNVNATSIGEVEFIFGLPGDVAFGGDADGDGRDSVFLYRPTSGFVYYTRHQDSVGPAGAAATVGSFFFGIPSDEFVIGDWNGDGVDTVGVFRVPQVLLRNSNTTGTADQSFIFGEAGWVPVAGIWF